MWISKEMWERQQRKIEDLEFMQTTLAQQLPDIRKEICHAETVAVQALYVSAPALPTVLVPTTPQRWAGGTVELSPMSVPLRTAVQRLVDDAGYEWDSGTAAGLRTPTQKKKGSK